MADEDVNRLVFGPGKELAAHSASCLATVLRGDTVARTAPTHMRADFEYAEFLSNTEVAVLLDATVEQRTRSVPGYRPPECVVGPARGRGPRTWYPGTLRS